MSKKNKAAKNAETLAAKAAKKAVTTAPVVKKLDQSAATATSEKPIEDPKPTPDLVVEPKKEEKPKDKSNTQKK